MNMTKPECSSMLFKHSPVLISHIFIDSSSEPLINFPHDVCFKKEIRLVWPSNFLITVDEFKSNNIIDVSSLDSQNIS
jgi:hypothetical protein